MSRKKLDNDKSEQYLMIGAFTVVCVALYLTIRSLS